MIERILNPLNILNKKSCFLFGPRQTGKTFLIKQRLPDFPFFSLLDNQIFFEFSKNPSRLREILPAGTQIAIIDEIQKLPSLLDEIQLLIEDRQIRFLLTGSSARKLRSNHVNLLGGRARSRILHPFSAFELKERFELLRALNYGLVPSIYLSDDPKDDLRSYCGDYLRMEIAGEALVRNLNAFSRFLEIAAVCNGQLINYSKISSDAAVPRTTVIEYFQILKDTLIGSELPAWQKSVRRKAITTSKFYFFDIGVCRALKHAPLLQEESHDLGESFEHFIFHEIISFLEYNHPTPLYYWRSTSGFEVDFIVEDQLAVEVKSAKRVSDHDLKGLRALKEEALFKHFILVSRETVPRITSDGIQILPWQAFVDRLWSKDLIVF